MPMTPVAGGQPIRSTHVNQFRQWVLGEMKDQSATFVTTHATEYTVTITNEETSTGNALKIVSGASTIAEFNKAGVSINVPITSTNVLLASLFATAGDLLVGAGVATASRLALGSAHQSLNVNGAGTGLTYAASLQSLLVSAGSMIGASAANTPVHIPKGSALQALVMNAGATGQTWASCALALATTQGQVFYASTSGALTALPIGATGQFLTTDGNTPSWGAGPTSGITRLDQQTGGGGTATTFTFTNISGAYRELVIVGNIRANTGSSTFQTLACTLNGDTGANYIWNIHNASAGTSAVTGTAGSFMNLGFVPDAGSFNNSFGSFEIRIPGYASTSFWKPVISNYAMSATTGVFLSGLGGGVWAMTPAITRVTIFINLGMPIHASSVITMYGLTAT